MTKTTTTTTTMERIATVITNTYFIFTNNVGIHVHVFRTIKLYVNLSDINF